MRKMRDLVIALGVICVALTPLPAWSQSELTRETINGWVGQSDGHPCETQEVGLLLGYAPIYPPAALAELTSGNVLVLFDTKYADGVLSIENARVYASSPSGTFDSAALAAAEHFVFTHAMRDCEGIRAMIRFRAENDRQSGASVGYVLDAEAIPPLSAEAVAAVRDGDLARHCGITGRPVNFASVADQMADAYPVRAVDRNRHWGDVIVRFTVGTDGRVGSPQVVSELPLGLGFGDAALQVVSMAQYPVRPAACEGAVTTIHFRLE